MMQIRFIPEGERFSPEGIADRWLETFASAVPADKRAALINCSGDYLWQILFCPEISCLTGIAARTAYDEESIAQVLFFEAHKRDHDGYSVHDLVLAAKASLGSAAVNAYADAFVIAPDFSWTYVHTHEGDDFFCRRP